MTTPDLLHYPIVFLDIDGVLIAYPEGIYIPPEFNPDCVAAFRTILDQVPHVRVVFSSTWRYPEHVKLLNQQWEAHGFSMDLAIDSTPDLRSDPELPRLHARGHEIQTWLKAHPHVDHWVVLDDARSSIEPILGTDRCVFTDSEYGLEQRDAERAIQILSEYSNPA